MSSPTVSLQDVLEMPSFVIVLPKDKGYTLIHNSVIGCDYLGSSAQGILHWLLSLPAGWDGQELYVRIMTRFKMCKSTAYKRIHELEDAGHLHRIMFKGLTYGDVQKRHKVTEMRFIRENPRERIWVHNARNQPYHVRNSRMSQKGTEGMQRTVCLSPQPLPEPERKKARIERRGPAARELTQSARARRRAAFFGATPIPTFRPLYKGRSKKILHSSESLNPLTPFSKENSFDEKSREKIESIPTPGRQHSKKAAAPAPETRQAAAAAFDAAGRSSRWLQPGALDVVWQARRVQDARLISTWGQRDGLHVSPADVERFLLHPVTGMLQVILGRETWTYRDLSQWCRRAGRTISAEEVLTFWRAFFKDDSVDHGYAPGNVRDLLSSTHWRRRTSNPHGLMREHFSHEFIPYAQCLTHAREVIADMPWHPADLLTHDDFN